MSANSDKTGSLSQQVLDVLDKLSTFDSIIDVSSLWATVSDGGAVGGICRVAAYLLFLTTLIAVVKQFFMSGFSFRLSEYWGIFAKAMLILLFFCVLYSDVSTSLANIATAMYDGLASESMKEFRTQVRKFLFTVQAPPPSPENAGIVHKIIRGIGNLLSIAKALASLPMSVMVAALVQLLVMFIFLFLSIGPFFIAFALFLGPIAMSMSMVLPVIARGWVTFLLASIMFSFATSVGLIALAQSELMSVASSALLSMQHLQVLIVVALILVYLTMTPFILAQVFSCSAYNFTGRIFGWLYSLSVVFSPIVVLSEMLNATVQGSFKKM